MTSDEFGSRYKLLKQMAVKEGRSYTAEQLSSGRAVLVHILDEGGVGGSGGLQELLQQLPPRDRARILDTMPVDGSLVVVTQFLQGFEGFESWLRSRLDEPVAPPPMSAPEQPSQLHGEFTRLFRSAGDTPAPAPASPGFQTNPPQETSSPGGSGFTDLFRASVHPTSDPQDPGATIPPIRMVGVRLPSEVSPAASIPPARIDPPAAALPPKLTPNFEGIGTAQHPPDLAGWPRPDEVVIRTQEPAAPALPQPSWDGPSEYTRLFGSAPQPTGELALPGEPPQPAELEEDKTERKRSYIPLFAILNVVFILATGLVVYFALRRC